MAWLEGHGCTVINGRQALELEVSKVAQALACRSVGLRFPYTEIVAGADAVLKAAEAWGRSISRQASPLVLKPNCGGSGNAVQHPCPLLICRPGLLLGSLRCLRCRQPSPLPRASTPNTKANPDPNSDPSPEPRLGTPVQGPAGDDARDRTAPPPACRAGCPLIRCDAAGSRPPACGTTCDQDARQGGHRGQLP